MLEGRVFSGAPDVLNALENVFPAAWWRCCGAARKWLSCGRAESDGNARPRSHFLCPAKVASSTTTYISGERASRGCTFAPPTPALVLRVFFGSIPFRSVDFYKILTIGNTTHISITSAVASTMADPIQQQRQQQQQQQQQHGQQQQQQPGPPQIQPGQQPTQEQIAQMQAHLKAEAERLGITVEEFVQRLNEQAMRQKQEIMRQMQAQQQQQQQGGQQQPIQPGPPKPEAIALAKFLKAQDLKPRTCIFQEKRKDMFKGMA